MKKILCWLLFCTFSSNLVSSERFRRSINELGDLIECQTGRKATDYVNYGCWCGIGGSNTPVDGVDSCCEEHDKCCDELLDSKTCQGLDIYTKKYNYPEEEMRCPLEKGVHCENFDNCATGLCKCDWKLATCLRESTFHDKYYKYSRFIGCSVRTLFDKVSNLFQ